MSSAHLSADRRPHLVLLQGGKDDTQDGDGSADWQRFCDQIGWQSPTSAPPDDLEDRLAERLFAKPTAEDNVVHLDLVRAVRTALETEDAAEAEANFAPVSGAFRVRVPEPLAAPDRRPAGRDRVTFAVAAAALAVAAVTFLVVARLAISNPRSPSASSSEASAEIAPRATVAPCSDDADDSADGAPIEALSPSESAPPRRAPRPEKKASKPDPRPPAPSPTTPEPPGALVARRALVAPDSASDSASAMAHLVRTGASLRDPRETAIEPRPVVADRADRAELADLSAPSPISADPSVSWGVVGAYRSGLPAADTVAPASAPLRATSGNRSRASTGVWSDGPEATDSPDAPVARRANASWSLAPARDRWIGASWTPPAPTGTAPSNVGVMVQLDLGMALGNKL